MGISMKYRTKIHVMNHFKAKINLCLNKTVTQTKDKRQNPHFDMLHQIVCPVIPFLLLMFFMLIYMFIIYICV